MILSRAQENKIICWKPELKRQRQVDTRPTKLRKKSNSKKLMQYLWTFQQEHAQFWFIRFATDRNHRILACGNGLGNVELWDLGLPRTAPSAVLKQGTLREATVRWLTFAPNNKFLLGACDDGTIWIWDVEYTSPPNA